MATKTRMGPIRTAFASPLPPIPADAKDSVSHQQPSATALCAEGRTVEPIESRASTDLADPNAANPVLVSLHVCKDCQHSLMGAFDHCLSKHHGGSALQNAHSFNLESIHQIDEVEDAKILTEPPYFELIPDPTKRANTIFDDILHKVERDRTVYYQGKMNSSHNQGGPNSVSKDVVLGGKFFSGSLYKRTLEQKDKEIRMLREKIYDLTCQEKLEHNNVMKLQAALKKSMRFYQYAEEWQSHESARLVQDVRCLKAEMSSLMAFLINSEEEKRMLMVQIKECNDVIASKDARIGEVEKEKEQVKDKLHQSYKEYLSMNEKIVRLQKEAEHGSDSIISRNEVLQRNLDKLSRDFEVTAKELNAYQTKTRELEFELEEMVSQFNMTGEAKRITDDLNVKLTAELDMLTKNHKELRKLYETCSQHEQQLENDLSEAKSLHMSTKRELEEKAQMLSDELDIYRDLKAELEVGLKSAKGEIEKLSSGLKSMTRSKDQLESAYRNAVQKHEKEIAKKEERIEELAGLRSDDQNSIKKLQETKEQLMFQVTDLQNALDRESANVNIMTFEIQQLKRTSEEKTAALEEQLEKANVAKTNLANDKRQLTDKIKLVRDDLKKKEGEYDELSATFEKHKEAAAAAETGLREELKQLQTTHKSLIGEYKTLEQKQNMTIESNVGLTFNIESLKKKLSALEGKNLKTEKELSLEKELVAKITTELETTVAEKKNLKIYLDSVVSKLEETNHTLEQERGEYAATLKEKSEIIMRTSAELYKTQEEEKRLADLSHNLKKTLDNVEKELAQTKVALEAETHNREQFEMHLYDLRRNLNNERKTRLEFERVHSKLNRMQEAREMDKIAAQRMRDRKLAELSKNLQSEYHRLKAINGLLPTDSGAPILDSPEIPAFNADSPAATSTHKPETRHPDVRFAQMQTVQKPLYLLLQKPAVQRMADRKTTDRRTPDQMLVDQEMAVPTMIVQMMAVEKTIVQTGLTAQMLAAQKMLDQME
ncbi:hypothetical protein HDV05_005287 [Chytridiales sp. JEL 0842]|nr:hypothetical protein HDV05_005287 [Chytridiales sp. JEL 0842]